MTRKVSTTITESTYQELKDLSDWTGFTMSSLLRKGLEKILYEYSKHEIFPLYLDEMRKKRAKKEVADDAEV